MDIRKNKKRFKRLLKSTLNDLGYKKTEITFILTGAFKYSTHFKKWGVFLKEFESEIADRILNKLITERLK